MAPRVSITMTEMKEWSWESMNAMGRASERWEQQVSFLQFAALTGLIWVTWGNGLMTVSWLCFSTEWVGGLGRPGRDGLWCTVQ